MSDIACSTSFAKTSLWLKQCWMNGFDLNANLALAATPRMVERIVAAPSDVWHTPWENGRPKSNGLTL